MAHILSWVSGTSKYVCFVNYKKTWIAQSLTYNFFTKENVDMNCERNRRWFPLFGAGRLGQGNRFWLNTKCTLIPIQNIYCWCTFDAFLADIWKQLMSSVGIVAHFCESAEKFASLSSANTDDLSQLNGVCTPGCFLSSRANSWSIFISSHSSVNAYNSLTI